MATELNIEQGLFYVNATLQAWAAETRTAAQDGMYSEYTQTIPGEGAASIQLHQVTNAPVMRAWTGARQHKALRHYSQTITYQEYEATLTLKKRLVDLDPAGVIQSLLPNFTQQLDAYDSTVAAQFYAASGVGPTGFDGVVLFSASHPHSSTGSTQSNIGAGTNLSHANLAAAEAVGGLWLQENGRPVRPNFSRMHVGMPLKRRAMELLGPVRVVGLSASDAEGGTTVAVAARPNTYSGTMNLSVDVRAGNVYYWTLIDESRGPIRPMILFDVEAINVTECTSPDHPEVFNNRNYVYGVQGKWGIGAGHWYTCYRGTGTA